jgi:hypothetical protein
MTSTVYLKPSQNFDLSNGNVSVFGNVNNEIVNLADNISAVTIDINVEAISLPYSTEEYQYQAVAGQLLIYRNSVLITKVAIQTDSDGTNIGFNNGYGTYTSSSKLIGPYNEKALISGSEIKIGNGVVSSTVPANLNYSASNNSAIVPSTIYLNPGQGIDLSYGYVLVYGNVNNEIVNFTEHISSVTIDSNVEAISLPYSIEEYQYQAVAGQIFIYRNSILIAKVAIQNDSDGTNIGFNNGYGTYTSANNLIGPYIQKAVISGSDIKIGNGFVSSSAPANLNYSVTAIYSLTSNSTSVNEGSTATFTLKTTNVATGTVDNYTLSGVSAADVIGGLTGSTTVGNNGLATIAVAIVADNLTEGNEVMTLALQGQSATIIINDTSPSPTASGSGQQYAWNATSDTTITGTTGIDTLNVSGYRSDVIINKLGAVSNLTHKVTKSTASTLSVERIKFLDVSVALDLDGAAGNAVQMLGAVMGKDSLSNKSLVGIAISIFDQAKMSPTQIARLALDAVLGENPSHKAVVDLLYKNLMGISPDALSETLYVGMIKNGAYTQESITLMATTLDINKTNINLLGLSQTGVEYTPSLF